MSTDQSTNPVEYREIERLPGYRFGDDGSVWSCLARGQTCRKSRVFTDKWRRMKESITTHHYLSVRLMVNNKDEFFRIHRLILEAFVGPCPEGMECCHTDGNRLNNSLENLRWDTPDSNLADRDRHQKTCKGSRHGRAKLCENDVLAIRRLCLEGMKQKDIAEMFAISPQIVSGIHCGGIWKHVTSN